MDGQKDMQENGWMDGQLDGWTERRCMKMDGWIVRWTESQTCEWVNGWMDRNVVCMYGCMKRQTCRKMLKEDRQMKDRQTDGDKKTQTDTYSLKYMDRRS